MSMLSKLTARASLVFVMLTITWVSIVYFHSAQYLPATPQLFWTVFIARLILILVLACCSSIVVLFFVKKTKRGEKNIELLKLMVILLALCASVFAIVTTWLSRNNEVSEGLLQLYVS